MEKRPGFVLAQQALNKCFSLRVEPCYKRALAQAGAILRAQHDARAGGDHAGRRANRLIERGCLEIAEARLAVLRENVRDALKAAIKVNDWNQVHLIARGNTIIQILNGSVTSVLVDDDTKNRALSGLVGFQMHVGPPMKLELRNVWLRKLD